ncbi:MAG: TIM barrel protein, partial [Clostridia bacterium]|nr:TIM barrel protein [Clostridia bacterium]
MKLSFSTKGWHEISFEEFCDMAENVKFQGIELHNIYNKLFTDKDGAFHDYAAAATLRRLYERKLSIPCIDVIGDIASGETADKTVSEIESCMEIAENLHIPFVRLRAAAAEDTEAAFERTKSLLSRVISMAEEKIITLIVETAGLFCRTRLLRDLLDSFACDSLGALWDMSASFFESGETPEQMIQNLGAYVRHVHISDAEIVDGELCHCLMGEGALPIAE